MGWADHPAVGRRYRKLAGEPATAGGLVLEKLPHNYLYVGAITLALPDAPIVLVRRSPLDNGLAMFTTLFGTAYPFSYDLVELGRYFAAYARLMDHWKACVGGRILEVSYEHFVDAPGRLGPHIANHCGLEWDPAALLIENNKTASATASAVQVRRPIYRTAAGRWRNYARQLEPLKRTLADLGVIAD